MNAEVKMARTNATIIAWFIGGAALGAAVALLLAPGSGDEVRKKIAEGANKGGKALTEQGQEIWKRGRELYERGRDLADEAADLFERGKKIAEKNLGRL